MLVSSIEQLIGNTPLVELKRIAKYFELNAKIFGKKLASVRKISYLCRNFWPSESTSGIYLTLLL